MIKSSQNAGMRTAAHSEIDGASVRSFVSSDPNTVGISWGDEALWCLSGALQHMPNISVHALAAFCHLVANGGRILIGKSKVLYGSLLRGLHELESMQPPLVTCAPEATRKLCFIISPDGCRMRDGFRQRWHARQGDGPVRYTNKRNEHGLPYAARDWWGDIPKRPLVSYSEASKGPVS